MLLNQRFIQIRNLGLRKNNLTHEPIEGMQRHVYQWWNQEVFYGEMTFNGGLYFQTQMAFG